MRGQVLFAKLGDMSTATIPLRVPTFDLSDRLRKARESAGFDQVQLSEQIGISRTSISAAERGSSKPRKAVLIAWAFATRVPFEWLMTGSTNNETPDPDGAGGRAPAVGFEPTTVRLTVGCSAVELRRIATKRR